jgi:hypothetical protein
VGDLILAFAFRDGSTTAPSLPSGVGWRSEITDTGTSCAARVASKFATTDSETTGTFTNSTSVVFQVWRNAGAIGTPVGLDGTATTVTYPALTLRNTAGNSWVAGFAGHRSVDTSLQTAPTGMSNRVT